MGNDEEEEEEELKGIYTFKVARAINKHDVYTIPYTL
jgi:hypothetical protein